MSPQHPYRSYFTPFIIELGADLDPSWVKIPNYELPCPLPRSSSMVTGAVCSPGTVSKKMLRGKRETKDHEKQLVGGFSPTHLKNMSQIGSFPHKSGWKIPKMSFELPPPIDNNCFLLKTSNFPDQTWGNITPRLRPWNTSRLSWVYALENPEVQKMGYFGGSKSWFLTALGMLDRKSLILNHDFGVGLL